MKIFIIKLLKKIFPSIVLDRIKKILKRRYTSLNNLDKKLEKYLDYNKGFFIELGANDGICQSNTYYFEKFKSWRGILVEPIPQKYLECIKNRSKNNSIFCKACVSFDYNKEHVDIIYSNLMSSSVNLESDISDPEKHAKHGEKYLDNSENIFTFQAEASTLNELIISSNAPKLIDLLSLDVEGVEIEVLKGIDHNAYKFKYILVECRNLDKIQDYLKKFNYVLKEKMSNHDYLFKLN